MPVNVPIYLAFLAGLASFLSPCVVSLVPAYIGYLSGRSLSSGAEDARASRWFTFTHGLAFVLGFSAIFITVGAIVYGIGELLFLAKPWIARIGGLVVIVFGLHMTGMFRIPFLEYDFRPQNRADRGRSYVSSFLMGVFFSAGWSPCTGPVLGMIYTQALLGASLLTSVSLLGAYSMGLAIPFLAASIGVGWVTLLLRRYGHAIRYVEIAMGVIMIVVGAMLFLGLYERIALQFQWFFIDFNL